MTYLVGSGIQRTDQCKRNDNEMIDGTVLTAPALDRASGIRHGFFTREGGVSEGIYAALNCGLGSADERARVLENRNRVAAHLDTAGGNVMTAYQIHSARALVIDEPFAPGTTPEADALVTATPGLAVGALAADCTPVLFADPEARIVAAAHSGWRGAVSGILSATVAAMESIGGDRTRICAAIGPTIHQPNYEVGPEFEAEFTARDPSYSRFFVRPQDGARPHFDLPGFCRHALDQCGIASVEDIGRCTYADESLFFSYRRKTNRGESDYGRQISAIVVA
jgi:YfiH family protein